MGEHGVFLILLGITVVLILTVLLMLWVVSRQGRRIGELARKTRDLVEEATRDEDDPEATEKDSGADGESAP